MIPDFTKTQLSTLQIDPNKPLVICDVDEVVVHFTKRFEGFLSERNLWLETNSLALAGNIRNFETNETISTDAVSTSNDSNALALATSASANRRRSSSPTLGSAASTSSPRRMAASS